MVVIKIILKIVILKNRIGIKGQKSMQAQVRNDAQVKKS